MNFNEDNLDAWVKIDLPNGKHLYVREHKEQFLGKKESHVQSGKIKIHKKRVLGRSSFILVDSENDFEGFVEFVLCDDSARLIERAGETDLDVEAHEEFNGFRRQFSANPGLALFTNKEKRGKGIGKELLYYGFLYLKKKGIDVVEIGSASNERTKKFYRDNGATFFENSDFPKEFTNLEERIEELKNKLGINSKTDGMFAKEDSSVR